MPDKTILIATNSSWNIINFRSGLIRALQAEGYRVAVLAPPDAWSDRFAGMAIDYHPIEMDQKGVSPRGDLKLWRNYLKALRMLRPDVFLGYTVKPNVYGSLAAHALGIPVINNVSGLGTAFIRENWLTRIVSTLYRRAFQRSRVVFFQNADDRNLFVGKRIVRPAQVRLLPGSGIDPDHYRPSPRPAADSEISFLLIARMIRDKGVSEFVEAARLLKAERPDLSFRLLGPVGAANRTAFGQEDVDAWVAEGVVDYLGTADDVRPHIAAADCVVLPSYREGLPRTLLEGAAMARPLIATDVAGCRDVVSDGLNGLLCQVRNVPDLAHAMRKMASYSVDRREQFGQSGREIVEQRFNERIVYRHYLKAIAYALAPGRQAEW